jgi:hypothetical protein
MAGESWMQVVQRVYKTNKAKNSSYKFKQAMVDAKKVYKHGGPSAAAEEGESAVTQGVTKKSRKHRKSKSRSKSGRKTRKSRRHRKH